MNVLNLKMKPRLSLHPKRPRPHITITAENIAKATRGARERAYLAANYVLGSLTIINPTVKLAARTFKVSVPTIATAVAELEATTTSTSSILNDAWKQATPEQRAALVRSHLGEMWALFERFTSAA